MMLRNSPDLLMLGEFVTATEVVTAIEIVSAIAAVVDDELCLPECIRV